MSFMHEIPELEAWLAIDADRWAPISVHEYVELVRRWRSEYMPLIDANETAHQGERAILAFARRLPADVWIFSGVRIPKLANAGGRGAAGFKVSGLRRIQRSLANQLELIALASDFTWSCVFSHEAGAFVSECMFERTSYAIGDDRDSLSQKHSGCE